MPTDPEEASASERPKRATEDRPKKKKRSARPKVTEPLDESKIRAPDNQTLGMLGVLGVVTLVLWALAHSACNYHPPRETRRPRVVKTEEFTREPKGAAIEAIQRLALYDYKGALEIASGPLAEEVKKEQASCAAEGAACAAKKAAVAGKAQSLGIVLDRDMGSARVRVVTRGVPGAPKAVLVRVERDGATWKATSRVPEAPGAVLPPPVISQPQNPHSFMMQTPPAASGAPAGSAPRRLVVPTPSAPAPAPAAPSAR
jgi:hypothetical protein